MENSSFKRPDFVYLNNAASSHPKPESVYRSVTAFIRKPPYNPYRSDMGTEKDEISQCRSKLARLFNCQQPERVILTSGATEALNLAIGGLDLRSGDSIVFTDVEHNSALRPLHHFQTEKGIVLRRVHADAAGFVHSRDIAAAMDRTTKAVIATHVSNVTGVIQDIPGIGTAVKQGSAVFIVDASQSAGAIPIDVHKMNADILVFTGHKNLFGLPGTGGLYVKTGIELRPWKTGGTGIRSDLLFQPEEMPLRLEAGTPNTAGIVSLSAGVDYVFEEGIDRIGRAGFEMKKEICQTLRGIAGLTLYAAVSESLPIVSFRLDGQDPRETGFMLQEGFGIQTRSGLHCAPLIHSAIGSHPAGTVRVSCSYLTDRGDLSAFFDAVRKIAAATGRRHHATD